MRKTSEPLAKPPEYYLRQIPSIAHFIWSNKNGLPLSRFLSIASFAAINPGFKIIVHTFPTNVGDVVYSSNEKSSVSQRALCYWDQLKSLPGTTVISHDLKALGIDADAPPAIISDILRYYILWENGGWYFDTDILFVQSMYDVYINSRLYSDYTLIISATKRYAPPYDAIRIGALASRKNSRFFFDAYTIAKGQRLAGDYQIVGAILISRLLGIKPYRAFVENYFDELIHNISDRLFYLYEPRVLSMSPVKSFADLGWGAYQCGFHWYGGVYGEEVTNVLDVLPQHFPPSTVLREILQANSLIQQAFLCTYDNVMEFFSVKSIRTIHCE